MIVFDLDGTLADCEHRRHFVDRDHPKNQKRILSSISLVSTEMPSHEPPWRPDWEAFFDACDQDEPISPVIQIWDDQISLGAMSFHKIWSGRSESVRKKTEKWLNTHLLCFESHQLKMRPIGNTEPDEVLKERWLDEEIEKGKNVNFVFDDGPKAIRMWRRRGIFVFDCNQTSVRREGTADFPEAFCLFSSVEEQAPVKCLVEGQNKEF